MAKEKEKRNDKQILNIRLDGLYTNPNNLSQVPEGSMSQADNVVLNAPGIMESRRGQQVFGSLLSDKPTGLFNYRNTLLTHTADNKLLYDSDGFGTWTAYSGTYAIPTGAVKIHSVEQNKNFYFTSSTGIKKIDKVTNTPKAAGAPPALGGTGVTTGTTGFFLSGTNVAYQVVWGYTDANNNLVLGAPSSPILVSNATIGITGTTTISTNTITAASSLDGITAGQIIVGTGIPVGTTVVSTTAPSTITMSANATSSNTLHPITFGFNTNVNLTFVIPSGITSEWIYQVYRSQFSANLTSSPGVEYAQVIQGNPTAGELAAKSITVLDNTPVDLTGALLYTNPSQGGAASAQYQPPLATDICFYAAANRTFYANTVDKQRLNITLLGAGNGTAFSYVTVTGNMNDSTTITNLSTTINLRVGQLVIGNNVPANTTIVSINTSASTMVISNATTGGPFTGVSLECEDGITIGSVTYYGSSNPTLGNQFLVSTSSDPALAITNTVYALINAINTFSGSVVYAYYQSGFDDLPGKILLQEINIGGAVFYATSNNGDSFNPELPLTGTTVASDPSLNQNYLWWSSYSQPESVPLANSTPVGSADYPIKRILALRQSIMIFKDDGIFRLSGTTPADFKVFLLDSTTILSAPESAVNFNNQIYFISLQGVASLSDNSTPVIISIPIDNILNQISDFPKFSDVTFAVGYESERTYLLSTVSEKDDTYPTQVLAFNYVTNAWTRWVLSRSCGIVSIPNSTGEGNLLYMGNPVNKQIYQERKTFTLADYADEQYAVNITSFNAFTINLTSSSNVRVGQTLGQSYSQAIVTRVVSSTQIIVDKVLGWVTGTAYVYNPILNQVTWNPFTGDNPGIVKHFREATFMFRDAAFTSNIVSYSSNFATSSEIKYLVPVSQGSWGNFPWGTQPWGGILGGIQAIRTYITPNQSRGNWLNVKLTSEQAFTSFSLQGISIMVTQISERFK